MTTPKKDKKTGRFLPSKKVKAPGNPGARKATAPGKKTAKRAWS